jgi:ubiquinone/menaquinone biosynthesis C-methylase UbiE
MLKRMAPSLAQRCIDEARRSHLSDPVVRYPQWYLQRWHFLPEGYLSRRSAAGYERLIRNVYNAASEGRVLARLVDSVARQAPRTLVELGCGPGRGLEAIASRMPACELAGLDLSPFMLERAERRLEESAVAATLVHGTGMHAPLPSESFDAAVATHFFGHLPKAAAQRAWEEASRILRPGGRLYVVDHAWHPRLNAPFGEARSAGLLRGILRFTILEKAGAE